MKDLLHFKLFSEEYSKVPCQPLFPNFKETRKCSIFSLLLFKYFFRVIYLICRSGQIRTVGFPKLYCPSLSFPRTLARFCSSEFLHGKWCAVPQSEKRADGTNYKPPAECSSPHHSGRFMWALADVITSQSLLGNCYIMRSV